MKIPFNWFKGTRQFLKLSILLFPTSKMKVSSPALIITQVSALVGCAKGDFEPHTKALKESSSGKIFGAVLIKL